MVHLYDLNPKLKQPKKTNKVVEKKEEETKRATKKRGSKRRLSRYGVCWSILRRRMRTIRL